MKVIFKTTDNIPNGFKCTGCMRLKKSENAIKDKVAYYCELSGYWCELGSDGVAIKTDDCLMQTRKYLIRGDAKS